MSKTIRVNNVVKGFLRDKEAITKKVELLLETETKKDVAKMIGIGRNTIYKRLENNQWKIKEIEKILKITG